MKRPASSRSAATQPKIVASRNRYLRCSPNSTGFAQIVSDDLSVLYRTIFSLPAAPMALQPRYPKSRDCWTRQASRHWHLIKEDFRKYLDMLLSFHVASALGSRLRRRGETTPLHT